MPADGSIIFRREKTDPADGPPLDTAFINGFLESVFDPGSVLDFLRDAFAQPENSFRTFDELIGGVRSFFAGNIPRLMQEAAFGTIDSHVLEQARKFAEFESTYRVDSRRYDRGDKPNPDAVFWPNPTREEDPISLFDTLPYVEAQDLIAPDTPIGSAGSCFANEIAYYLQDKSFNYVVTEPEKDAGTVPVSPARWGIIFNTPSFTQLAEKAFGVRELPRLAEFNPIAQQWQDPFRENVIFDSIEELEDNREHHIAACRAAFLTCKVFIITLGLNECWEYTLDGSVASRNPKSRLHYALFRHRTLSVAENIVYLQRFLDVLRANNPEIQVIVSVSPIPFIATGRGADQHVVTANEHSKAVLRVAAEEFVAANAGVHYFPSYEMVARCIRDPWEEDQRHVRRAAVARIMELFERMYVHAG